MLRILMSSLIVLACLAVRLTAVEHSVLTHGDGGLVKYSAGGQVEWQMPWGGIHDIHVLANGHIMVQQDMTKVVEIDPQTKRVVWEYDSTKNGNEGNRIEVHSFQPLGDGSVMIAESGARRIIEVNRRGEILRRMDLKVDHPDPHTDTRLVRKLSNGHYLVCHEADGMVREYDGQGQVVWEYEVPLFGKEKKNGHGPEAFGNKCFAAVRLPNGDSLISTGNGHSVIRVTRDKEIVWQLHQDDLPGVRLAWVTTLEVLSNGNYVIGNCHAGSGQPLLIEIEPKSKEVVWMFDHFDQLGNSVSNSVLLGEASSIR